MRSPESIKKLDAFIQADVPCDFITHLERALDKISMEEPGISVYGMKFSNPEYRLIEEDEGMLERFMNQLKQQKSKRC